NSFQLNFGSPLIYNATGPGATVTVPRTMDVKGFAVEYSGGGGLRCYNLPFTPPTYLGCQGPTSGVPRGFAELIVLGATQQDTVLAPTATTPGLIPQDFIPGTSNIHLYALNNCPFPTKLQYIVRINLASPINLVKGTVLSLWHSE